MDEKVIRVIKENKKAALKAKKEDKITDLILWILTPIDKIDKKVQQFQNNREQKEVWSDERTQEILEYYIPRISTWDKKKEELYFYDDGDGWGSAYAKKHLKRKDRRYWKKYSRFSGSKIREYLIKQFEMEGFKKELGDCSYDWTIITFKVINNN